MSDVFSDEDEPQQAPPEPTQNRPDGEYWKAEAEKAFKARDQARQDLRNQIQAGYDPAVVELVPQDLPPTEWKEYADKLLAFRGEAPNEPTAPSEPVVEAEPQPTVEEVQELAAVGKGPSGTATSSTGMNTDELLQIAMTDPERYQKLKAQGHELPKLSYGPDKT